ncbi:efflux RND transporter periplasmic adaptor subunit [Parasphingorhabdus litoris]|uniref:Efflux RND transporter periplasmic adaptor subunit n=1 Tax=Parasphingorhabdus litoris TaxID=394733 RepID=A0ABN1AD85_9SPHN|nr:efflux RND transporter periplasmic adaptor subunit [Parasphingorhabdus litoris]
MSFALPQMIRDNLRWVLIGGALLLVTLIYFLFFASNAAEGQGGPGQGGPPPAIVTLAKIEKLALTPNFTAPGDIVANRDSVVASEVAGRIQTTLNIGARVRRGTVIAVIDDRTIRLARDQARAEVARLQSDLTYQNRLVGRLQQLLEEEAESEASLDEAISTRDQTRARLAAAKVALETAQVDLARTRIRAPFAGQMVERRIEVGEYATPGREIARIVGREGSEARVRVPIAVAGSLSTGQEVTILADGEQRASRVRTVIETGDEVSRTVEVRAPMGSHNLKMGSAISITVPTGIERDVLTAPRDALVLRDSGIFIYVVNPKDKTAKRVNVQVGEPAGDRVAISGQIAAGDMIVVRGGERLRDGQNVTWDDGKKPKAEPEQSAG